MKFNSNRPEYSIPFELGYDLWFDMVNVDKPKRVLEHREYKVERTNETKTMRAMNMLFGLNPDLIVKFDGRFAKKKAEQTAEPRKSLVALATLEFLWSNYQSLYTVTNDPIEWMMRRKRCIEFIKSQADDSLYEYYD
jgi:hypothetical protein